MWESIWNNWFKLVVTSALGCSSSHPPPQSRGPSARECLLYELRSANTSRGRLEEVWL